MVRSRDKTVGNSSFSVYLLRRILEISGILVSGGSLDFLRTHLHTTELYPSNPSSVDFILHLQGASSSSTAWALQRCSERVSLRGCETVLLSLGIKHQWTPDFTREGIPLCPPRADRGCGGSSRAGNNAREDVTTDRSSEGEEVRLVDRAACSHLLQKSKRESPGDSSGG
jgi:hypothetical protein